KRFFCHREEQFSVFICYNLLFLSSILLYFFLTRGTSGRLLVALDWFWRDGRKYKRKIPRMLGEETTEAERTRVKLGENMPERLDQLPGSPVKKIEDRNAELKDNKKKEKDEKNRWDLYENPNLYYRIKKSAGFYEQQRKQKARNYHPLFGNMEEFYKNLDDYRNADRKMVFDFRSEAVRERDGDEGEHRWRYVVDLDYWFGSLAPRVHRYLTERREDKLRKKRKDAEAKRRKQELLELRKPVVFGEGIRKHAENGDENNKISVGKKKWGLAASKVHMGTRMAKLQRKTSFLERHLPPKCYVYVKQINRDISFRKMQFNWLRIRVWQTFRIWLKRFGVDFRYWALFKLLEKELAVLVRNILARINKKEKKKKRRKGVYAGEDGGGDFEDVIFDDGLIDEEVYGSDDESTFTTEEDAASSSVAEGGEQHQHDKQQAPPNKHQTETELTLQLLFQKRAKLWKKSEKRSWKKILALTTAVFTVFFVKIAFVLTNFALVGTYSLILFPIFSLHWLYET
ncbi:unnamed protein product, partial [Amoebophrya sp. A120]